MDAQDSRATWPQALITLLGPLLFFFFMRWLVVEPFVIPSGSMLPSLRVHDHILVNKLAYGVHLPFSKAWLAKWSSPQRGDIVVFRYPQNPDVFFVKRAIGLPHDHIRLEQGVLKINDEVLHLTDLRDDPTFPSDDGYEYFREQNHVVRYISKNLSHFEGEIVVPENSIFVMGDNRDESNDSRFWGVVPMENFVGRAWLIWLACHETLESVPSLCDPKALTWNRLLIRPQ